MDRKMYGTAEKAVTVILKIIVFGLAVYAILSQIFIHNKNFFPSDYHVCTGPFEWRDSSGENGIVNSPEELNIAGKEFVSVSCMLPDDLEDGMNVAFFTSRSCKVYIDGKLRFEFDTSKNKIPGDVVKKVFVSFKVSADDCNKKMTIVKNDVYKNNEAGRIFYGTSLALTKMVFMNEAPLYILSFVLIIFAVVVIIFGWSYRLIYRKGLSVTILAYAVLCVAFWCIYDSLLYQIVFNNYYIDGPMGYMIIMITPYPFICYLDIEQKKRYHNIYFILEVCTVVSFVLFSALHFLEIYSFAKTLIPMNCVIFLTAAVVLGILIYDIRKGYAKQYRLMVAGFIGMIFFCIVEIIMLNTIPSRTDGMSMILGLYFLLTMAVIQTIGSYIDIQRKTAKAIQANKTKSTFLANMSHEIRTPINAIMGMNEMILRESPSEEIKSYAVNIRSAGNNLLHIINDILDFSKIESGKMELFEEQYEMVAVLNDTINLVIDKINNKQLEFKTEFAPELPSMLYGDTGKIHQIITNILNNAVKYTNEGSVTLRVHCDILSEKQCELIIEVEDTGIGIREKDLKKLFKDFQRLDLKKNRGIEGTGLGLAITKRLVELMGGDVYVESEYEVGSKFTVSIPQKIMDLTPIGDFDTYYQKYVRQQSVYHEKFIAPDAKLLFVDDNEMNLMVAASLIEKNKMQIETALSANEMFELIKKNKYDIIFLDHMMPEIDGVKALNMSKEMPDNINLDTPVIALTANAIVGMKDEYLKKGFNDYLSKPINPVMFEEVILRYLPEEKVEFTGLIDVKGALAGYGDDEQLYFEDLKKYCDCIEEVIDSLNSCVETQDWEKYKEIVGSLKEQSLKIGATKISNLSKQLESACKKEKFDFVMKKNNEVENLYREIVDEAATSVFLQ